MRRRIGCGRKWRLLSDYKFSVFIVTTRDHHAMAFFLGWLLSPLAALNIGFLILCAFSANAPRHAPIWEGEGFGTSDWFAPYFGSSVIVYCVLCLLFWNIHLVFMYLPEDYFKPKIVWGFQLVFNFLASAFWIWVSIHSAGGGSFENPGWWLELIPIGVTIPMFLCSVWFFWRGSDKIN